jgi:hypothetical protein
LIARTGPHRDAVEQRIELLEVADLGLHLHQQALIAGFEPAVHPHDVAAVFGQIAAATVRTAGSADQNRLCREIVDCIDRIPGRPVAHVDAFRGLRDRTDAIDGFEQVNAFAAGNPSSAPRRRELGPQLADSASLLMDLNCRMRRRSQAIPGLLVDNLLLPLRVAGPAGLQGRRQFREHVLAVALAGGRGDAVCRMVE